MKVFATISTIAILVCSNIICNSLIITFNSTTSYNNTNNNNNEWEPFPVTQLYKFIISYFTNIPYNDSNSNKIQDKQQQQQQQQSPSSKIVEWRRRLQENNNEVQQPRLLWVHVGKCGGMTLEKFLPIKIPEKKRALPCIMKETTATTTNNNNNNNVDDAISKCIQSNKNKNNNNNNIPILSNYIFSHIHLRNALFTKEELEFVINKSNGCIFIVRKPLSRIISAFNYHYNMFQKKKGNKTRQDFVPRHKAAIFYMDCFSSINDLAIAMLLQIKKDSYGNYGGKKFKQLCLRYGKRVLQGIESGDAYSHIHAGYQFYEKKTLSRTINNNNNTAITVTTNNNNIPTSTSSQSLIPTFVIRTEHIWDDTAQLDIMLGGNGNFTNYGKAYTHGSERYKVSGTIETMDGKQAICCMIYLDIVSYHRIIINAINLNDNEKTDAIIESMKECGIITNSVLLLINNTNLLHNYGNVWENWYDETCNGTPSPKT